MKQFHTKGRENSGNCACFPPAHEPPPLPPFGHPLPLGGEEGRGEGAVGWFKCARRAQSSGRSLLGERAGVRASVSSNPIFGLRGGQPNPPRYLSGYNFAAPEDVRSPNEWLSTFGSHSQHARGQKEDRP